MEAPPSQRSAHLRRAAMALVVLAAIAAHARSLGADYVSLDDFQYVRDNPRVASGLTLESVRWAFQVEPSEYISYFHPLTWLSLMADSDVFGTAPWGHHLVNVLLHACTGVLLFLLLLRTTRSLGPSLVASLIFAVHPLTVESVAWITERKAVLSGVIGLAAMLVYARGPGQPSKARLAVVAALALLAALAKPPLVVLPALLLIVDVWPLGRSRVGLPAAVLRRLLVEKAFVALPQLVVFAVALHSARQPTGVPLGLRVENAVVSVPRYVALALWPHDLAVFHPFPDHVPARELVLAFTVTVLLTALAAATARRWPFVAAGWAWFLVAIAPYLGLSQYGLWPAFADRFMYLPLIGLAIVASFGGWAALRRLPRARTVATAAAAAAIVPLGVATFVQVGYWQDSVALFGRAATIHPDDADINYGLGTALASAGRAREALAPLERAVRLRPALAKARAKYGLALVYAGRLAEAGAQLDEALRLEPGIPEALFGRGQLFTALGLTAMARAAYAEFLERAPDAPEAAAMKAEALRRLGR